MKTIINTLMGAVLLITLLSSCDKKNDEDIKKNHVKIGDTEYVLNSGSLENYGQDENEGPFDFWQYDGYNLDLTLVSEGINASAGEDNEMMVTGSGQILYFEIFTSNSTSLDEREYNYDGISPFPVGTFDYGDYAVSWSAENEENEWLEITSGSVRVNKNGPEYEITIDCTDENGVRITGYYKGVLIYFDYVSEMKSMLSPYSYKRK